MSNSARPLSRTFKQVSRILPPGRLATHLLTLKRLRYCRVLFKTLLLHHRFVFLEGFLRRLLLYWRTPKTCSFEFREMCVPYPPWNVIFLRNREHGRQCRPCHVNPVVVHSIQRVV